MAILKYVYRECSAHYFVIKITEGGGFILTTTSQVHSMTALLLYYEPVMMQSTVVERAS